MIFKALMLDVDGTTVPYDYEALPSPAVTTAINHAQNHVTICFVTGRTFASLEKVLTALNMHKGFAVVNNGAHLIDIATKQIVHEQLLQFSEIEKIISIFNEEHIPFLMKGNPFRHEYIELPRENKDTFTTPMFITSSDFPPDKIDHLLKKLSEIKTISCHKTSHKNPHTFGIVVNHTDATKQYGIFQLEKHLDISRDQMIGVGDSYNDFPLLMACGLKVAMGNAIPELKEIADYVAPSS